MASSQSALGAPPGLAIMVVSQRALVCFFELIFSKSLSLESLCLPATLYHSPSGIQSCKSTRLVRIPTTPLRQFSLSCLSTPRCPSFLYLFLYLISRTCRLGSLIMLESLTHSRIKSRVVGSKSCLFLEYT
jgi:hypothetical protein